MLSLAWCILAILGSWCALELMYCLQSRARYAAATALVELTLDPKRIARIKQRFLSLASFMSLEEFISGWFFGASGREIKRRNAEDFVAYSIYCRRSETLSPEMWKEVGDFVRIVEKTWNVHFQDGFNPDIKFMAHLWEPLRTLHTPLFVHIWCELLNLCCLCFLRALGFRQSICKGVKYWIRAARHTHEKNNKIRNSSTSQAVSTLPCVFVHGIGLGLLPYLGFLQQLMCENPTSPLILLDIPHVSLRMGHRAIAFERIAEAAPAILCRHGYEDACFTGHSFGTFCISAVCQLFPMAVHSVVSFQCLPVD